MAAAAAAPSASADRSTRLVVSVIPASSASRPPRPGERHRRRGAGGHRPQPRRHRGLPDAEFGVPWRDPGPALRAVVPGPAQRDRAEHGVDGLGPVGDKLRLVPGAARHPRRRGGRGQRPAGVPARHAPSLVMAVRMASSAASRAARRRPATAPPRRPGALSPRRPPPRTRPGAPPFPGWPGRGCLSRPAGRAWPRRSPR